jgi:pimeloyl-ACP methyl ester carboxylesterase
MDIKWQSKTLRNGIHVYVGGDGSPVVLLPGWPESAEAYSEVFSSLSQDHQVWAVDPPGLGDSAVSTVGYDIQAISRLLEESINTAIPSSYHLVGHDVGGWIAYAWAAQFPDSVKSLTVLDCSFPGIAPPLSFPLSEEANVKLWQFSFNRLPDLPEVLTQGKERELLDWLFDNKAEYPSRITQAKRNRYVECYSRPGGMSNGFAYYRAITTNSLQNKVFAGKKLQMPVLALGGQSALGRNLLVLMKSLAVDVQGGEIEDCGHYLMEEQPEVVASKLLDFFRRVART